MAVQSKSRHLCPSLRHGMTVTYTKYAPVIPHLDLDKPDAIWTAHVLSEDNGQIAANFLRKTYRGRRVLLDGKHLPVL